METPTTESPEQETSHTPYSLLAKKAFPQGYHGEVAEQPETVVEIETETEIEPEVAQEVEEEAQEAAETPEEEEVVSSFDDLIQSQEWDNEWADSLTVKVKVDGEERPVKLADLRANYQIQEAAQKRLEEAKAAKESAKAEVAAQSEAARQQLVVAAKIIEKAEKSLQGDIEDTNFKELERVDPAEAALKKIQFQERRQNLDALKQEAIREYQKAVTQNQEEAQKALVQRLQVEGERLIERIPEWKSEETAKAEKANVSKYLSDLGYSDNEIANAYDHRMIVLARKAMLFDEGLKKLEPAKQKLKVVKKTIPPGSKVSTSQLNTQRKNEAKSKLRKSGSFDDALRLLRG